MTNTLDPADTQAAPGNRTLGTSQRTQPGSPPGNVSSTVSRHKCYLREETKSMRKTALWDSTFRVWGPEASVATNLQPRCANALRGDTGLGGEAHRKQGQQQTLEQRRPQPCTESHTSGKVAFVGLKSAENMLERRLHLQSRCVRVPAAAPPASAPRARKPKWQHRSERQQTPAAALAPHLGRRSPQPQGGGSHRLIDGHSGWAHKEAARSA